MRFREMEDSVRTLSQQVVDAYRSQFEKRGLRAELSFVERPFDGEAAGLEVRIELWKGNDLRDFMEMFAIRDGELVAPPSEFQEWLEEELEAILVAN